MRVRNRRDDHGRVDCESRRAEQAGERIPRRARRAGLDPGYDGLRGGGTSRQFALTESRLLASPEEQFCRCRHNLR